MHLYSLYVHSHPCLLYAIIFIYVHSYDQCMYMYIQVVWLYPETLTSVVYTSYRPSHQYLQCVSCTVWLTFSMWEDFSAINHLYEGLRLIIMFPPTYFTSFAYFLHIVSHALPPSPSISPLLHLHHSLS